MKTMTDTRAALAEVLFGVYDTSGSITAEQAAPQVAARLAERGVLLVTEDRLADELSIHRYGEDTEGIHGAWCSCDQWDDMGDRHPAWHKHAAAAIFAALSGEAPE